MTRAIYISKRLAVSRFYLKVYGRLTKIDFFVQERNDFDILNSLGVYTHTRQQMRYLERLSVDVFYRHGLTLAFSTARQKRTGRNNNVGKRWRNDSDW